MTSKRARENASLGNRIRAIQTGLAEIEAKNRTPAPDPEATTVENLRQQVAMLMSANWRIDQEQDYWDLRYYSSFPTISTVNRRGTTAERDAWYPLPATDAERVALANQKIVWFNTDTMWEESYYATTGLSGLTAIGVLTGHPAGWYPLGGALIMGHRGRTALAQATTGTPVELVSPTAQIRRGGVLDVGDSGLSVPVGGYYRLTGHLYTTGPPSAYVAMGIRVSGTSLFDISTPKPEGFDQRASGSSITAAMAGEVVTAWPYSAAATNVWGSTGFNGTFIEVEYLGPPLVNN